METNAEKLLGNEGIAVATRIGNLPDREFPAPEAWDRSTPVAFCHDWQGSNPDPERATEVRLLWSGKCLYIRFCARYRELYVYPGGNVRRDQLWLRDVAEVFLQPEPEQIRCYREFEISPNGDWIDLDISPGKTAPLFCDLASRVRVDSGELVWIADMALPMKCLTSRFEPAHRWRVNFYRVEGPEPNRFYSAWRPTHTPIPNFHVPEIFGELRFA